MLFLEGHARLVLVLHTLCAGVLVGSSTHHLLTCRHYLAGRFPRVRLEKLYAVVAASAFAITFLVGAALYPTYKVRVRAEYFDAPEAVTADFARRIEQADKTGSAPPPAIRERALRASHDLAGVAHAFDIKEHLVALGLAAAIALVLLSRRAHPSTDPRFAVLYVGLSGVMCGAAWIGAIVGIVTASFRSVGGLP